MLDTNNGKRCRWGKGSLQRAFYTFPEMLNIDFLNMKTARKYRVIPNKLAQRY